MPFGTAVRICLWTILFAVIVAVCAFLAIDVGVIDWGLNTEIKPRLDARKAFLWEQYGVNRDSIDYSLKVIGLACTTILGALALLRTWHFATINLPYRLQGYVDSVKEAHLGDRRVVLAPHLSRNLKGARSIALQPAFFDTLWSFVRTPINLRIANRLAGAVATLDGDIRVLGGKFEISKMERITAHLVAASNLAIAAESLPGGTQGQNSKYFDAYKEVRAALVLDPNDLDALEHSAKLGKSLGLRQQLQEDLEILERSAEKDKRPVRHARALRFQAELLEERATKAALNGARIKLETALGVLDSSDGMDNKVLELAFINEQLAELHLKRGTPTLVERYVDIADDLFASLPPPEGSSGSERVRELRRQLAQLLEVDDEPEEIEEQVEAVGQILATHVNLVQVPAFLQSTGEDIVGVVEPFTGLTLLDEDNGRVLVAKGGVRLGHVDPSKLQKLQ